MKITMKAVIGAAGLVAMCATPTFAKDTVVMYVHQAWQQVIQARVAEYEKAHPDVDVQVSAFDAGQYNEKLTAAAAGGVLPDLFMLDAPDVGRWADSLRPLDHVLTDSVMNDVVPAGLKMGQVNGQQKALPVQLPAYTVWYYNVDRFAELGVDTPKTWSDLFTLGRRFKATDGQGQQTDYALGVYTGGGWEGGWRGWQYLWQNNTNVLSTDGKRAELTGTKVNESLTHLQRLIKEGVATGKDYYAGFTTGHFGIIVEGVWTLDGLANQKDLNLGVLPAPPTPQGGTAVVQGSGWMLGVSAEASNAALDVLRSIYDARFDRERTKAVPPPVFRSNLQGYIANAPHPKQTEIALNYLNIARPFPIKKGTVQIVTALGDMFAAAYKGDYVNQAAADAQTKINAILSNE